MTKLMQQGGDGVGLFPANEYAYANNRTGATLALGDVVMFDIKDTDAGTGTTTAIGADASAYANVIDPTTAGIGTLSGASPAHPGYFFGVVVNLGPDAGADNALVKLQVRGLCRASCTADAITIGVPLIAANGVNTLAPSPAAGNKILALAREANSSTAGLYEVWFDGIDGFGRMEAS